MPPDEADRSALAVAATEEAAGAARPVKHSFAIAGHRTSISLERAFWDALREAAEREEVSLTELVRRIDQTRGDAGLSGAVRVWILAYALNGGLVRATDATAPPPATAAAPPIVGPEQADQAVHRGVPSETVSRRG